MFSRHGRRVPTPPLVPRAALPSSFACLLSSEEEAVVEFLHYAITVWRSRPALSASCDRNEATSSRRAAPSIPQEDGCHLTARLGLR